MPGSEVIGEEERREVNDVFDHGGVLFRHGFDAQRNGCYKVREFEQAFANMMNVPHALAVTSGTAALRVALAALDLRPGDEVVTQSFTFVATVEAIIEARGTPVGAEVDKTLNLDPKDLERRITDRTRAVIVVHMLGTPARLEEVQAICDRRGIALIEDTAWGCGGNLHGRALGTWGKIGTFSFDFAKTITTGEGGMVVFRDELMYKKASAWHDHGHENNPAFPRGEDTRSQSGFNFRMMELQGAIGLAQLRKLANIVKAQRGNRDRLWNAIQHINGLTLRAVPEGAYDTADALVTMLPDAELAQQCRLKLRDIGIMTKILPDATKWHFAEDWVHMPELEESHGGNLSSAFPRTRALLRRAVSLPVTVTMPDGRPEAIRTVMEDVLGV